MDLLQNNKNVTIRTKFVESELLYIGNFRNIRDLDIQDIPVDSGLYAIRIKDINILPKEFKYELYNRCDNLLYVGIATKNLRKRLWQDELHAKNPATFFRSIGAMLNYLPPKGSLFGKKNGCNYKFSSEDKEKIIMWMKSSLLINFITCNDDLKTIEKLIIKKYCPIINIDHNPQPFKPLQKLRKKCLDFARNQNM